MQALLTLPLGDHLDMLPTAPTLGTVDCVAAATTNCWCPSPRSAAGADAAAVAAVVAAAATAVEVLLPVAVPAVEALPTLEALLPLLPALLPPTVCARLKFIGIGLRIRSHSLGIRWGATWPGVHARWRMRLRFRLADPSLKIFTIKRKLHPLIGLDWFGEVTNVSIARWSYCCRVDEIDYDYGREKREGEKETWK